MWEPTMPRHRRNIDELLIAYLAAGKTVRETARLVGCGEATVHRRLADPAFRRAVQQARREKLVTLRENAVRKMLDGVTTLEDVLRVTWEHEDG